MHNISSSAFKSVHWNTILWRADKPLHSILAIFINNMNQEVLYIYTNMVVCLTWNGCDCENKSVCVWLQGGPRWAGSFYRSPRFRRASPELSSCQSTAWTQSPLHSFCPCGCQRRSPPLPASCSPLEKWKTHVEDWCTLKDENVNKSTRMNLQNQLSLPFVYAGWKNSKVYSCELGLNIWFDSSSALYMSQVDDELHDTTWLWHYFLST